jgi:hypothetical protein
MIPPMERKEVGPASAPSAPDAPIARLRARFGTIPPATSTPSPLTPLAPSTPPTDKPPHAKPLDVGARDTPAAPDALDAPSVSLDLPDDPAELQARVDALTADPNWASRWTERLKSAKWAHLDALQRMIAMLVDVAAERHRAGDLAGFRSWARFTLDHAAGKRWDEAARRPVALPADMRIITPEEAAATFADAEAVRQKRRPRPIRKDDG